MTIQISCECGADYNVPDERAGQSFPCSQCHRSVTVPPAAGTSEPVAVAAAPAVPKAVALPADSVAAPAMAHAAPAAGAYPAGAMPGHYPPKKSGMPGWVIVLIIVGVGGIVLAGVLAAIAIPIYQGFVDDAKWSEAEVTLNSIQSSAELYKSEYGPKALATIDIPAAPSFDSDAQWAALGFDTDQFLYMAYWDPQAFSFSGDATGGYTIIVNTANLSPMGNPPSEPGGITVVVNAAGAMWIRHGSAQ